MFLLQDEKKMGHAQHWNASGSLVNEKTLQFITFASKAKCNIFSKIMCNRNGTTISGAYLRSAFLRS